MTTIQKSSVEKRLWTSSCWYLLHLLSYFYQPKLYPYYARFYRKLGGVLPCDMCRTHYREYVRKYPIERGTNLIRWTIRYHNEVNSFTNKTVLTEDTIYDLLHVENGKDNQLLPPVNHYYIWTFLTIVYDYHIDNDHIPLYREFLSIFKVIIPCEQCRLDLNLLSMESESIATYLKIIKHHKIKNADKIKFTVA